MMGEIKSQAEKMKMKKRVMRKAAHILEICAGGGGGFGLLTLQAESLECLIWHVT